MLDNNMTSGCGDEGRDSVAIRDMRNAVKHHCWSLLILKARYRCGPMPIRNQCVRVA